MSIETRDINALTSSLDVRGIRGRYRAFIQDATRVRVVRYALGISLSIALAYSINWPLSFLTPILCAVFLATPLPVLPLKAGLLNMASTLLAFLFSFLFTLFFLPFPLVYSLLLGLVLFNVYYYLNRGGSFWLVLMLLLSMLIMPLLSSINNGLALGVVIGFVWSGWVTILLVWLVHFLVPDPVAASLPERAGFKPGYAKAPAISALKSTLVVWPLALLFIANNWTSQMLVMIFVAVFSLVPDLEKGRQAGTDSFRSTLIGGVFAWGLYWWLVAVPEFFFFILLMLLISLIFGQIIFSSKPVAKYYASAMSGVIVLLNGSMAEGAVFTENFFTRLFLILMATLYVVFALKLLDTCWPQKK